MKKIRLHIIITLILLLSSMFMFSQVLTNGTASAAITAENPFFDASTNFDYSMDSSNSGKGMVFPRTDLTTFTFRIENMDGINFPTALDGMIVYNAATGNTLAAVSGNNGVVTAVAPGYYYFSNPGQTSTVSFGKWMPLGSNALKNITSTEIATSIAVDGFPVYATKGTFVADGTTSTTTIVPPTGITGIYRITIYKTEVSTNPATLNNVISRRLSSEVYDFNLSLTVNNVITGNYPFSEVYPAGIYNYTLEYFK